MCRVRAVCVSFPPCFCVDVGRLSQLPSKTELSEVEFYGIVKVATMEVGIKSLFGDVGLEIEVQVNADSSAARSISSRKVLGEFDMMNSESCGCRRRSEEDSCPLSR